MHVATRKASGMVMGAVMASRAMMYGCTSAALRRHCSVLLFGSRTSIVNGCTPCAIPRCMHTVCGS